MLATSEQFAVYQIGGNLRAKMWGRSVCLFSSFQCLSLSLYRSGKRVKTAEE